MSTTTYLPYLTTEDVNRLVKIEPAVLGERIRNARLSRGLTQADVAGDLITAAYLSRIEDGQRRPAAIVLRAIADRVGRTPTDLLIGESPRTPSEQEERINAASRYVASAASAWLTDASDVDSYTTLVRSVDEWETAVSTPKPDPAFPEAPEETGPRVYVENDPSGTATIWYAGDPDRPLAIIHRNDHNAEAFDALAYVIGAGR